MLIPVIVTHTISYDWIIGNIILNYITDLTNFSRNMIVCRHWLQLPRLLSLNGKRMKDAKWKFTRCRPTKSNGTSTQQWSPSSTNARESAMDNFSVSHWSHWVCLSLTPVTVKCCDSYRTQILALQQWVATILWARCPYATTQPFSPARTSSEFSVSLSSQENKGRSPKKILKGYP